MYGNADERRKAQEKKSMKINESNQGEQQERNGKGKMVKTMRKYDNEDKEKEKISMMFNYSNQEKQQERNEKGKR